LIDDKIFPGKLIIFANNGICSVDRKTGSAAVIPPPAPPGEDRLLVIKSITWGYDVKNNNKIYFYAIANGEDIYVSNDLASWSKVRWEKSPTGKCKCSVETCLTDPSVIYLSLYGSAGVMKSSDYGENWDWSYTLARNTSENFDPDWTDWIEKAHGAWWIGAPCFMSVAPGDPDICFGTTYGTVTSTRDGGKTWRSRHTKYNAADDTYSTTGLDVVTCMFTKESPHDKSERVTGYADIGLMLSKNGGESWSSAIGGVPDEWSNQCYDLIYDPDVKGKAWAAWSGLHDLPFRLYNLEFQGGVCVTDPDKGISGGWRVSSDGLPASCPVTSLALDISSPADNRILYAAVCGHGVYKSINGGKNWLPASAGINPEHLAVYRLHMTPGGRIYLIAVRYRDDHDGVLYFSDDGARSWDKINLPGGVINLFDVKHDPENSEKGIYIAAWSGGGWMQGAKKGAGGIWHTPDGGVSWENISDPSLNTFGIAIDQSNPGRIIYVTYHRCAFYSGDRGKTWRRIEGFEFTAGTYPSFDPLDASKAYITTFGGGLWHGPLPE
jgi:photosystem II stability/assembly factor-like uncharacterized protein